MIKDIAIGDRIKFRAATWTSDRAVWRKVNGFFHGRPTVRFNGWPEFIVRDHEIIDIDKSQPNPRPQKPA